MSKKITNVSKFERRLKPRPAFLEAAREILGGDESGTILRPFFDGDVGLVKLIEERAHEIEGAETGPRVIPYKTKPHQKEMNK